MKVTFKNKKLGELINNNKKLVRKYGPQNARLIVRRLNELKATESLGIMVKFRIGRCHPLKGNLKGMYGLDLDHPDRLIIQPVIDKNMDVSKLNLHEIKEVIVWEVKDYHG